MLHMSALIRRKYILACLGIMATCQLLDNRYEERKRKERETLTIRESGYKGRFTQFLKDFLFSESLKLN